MIQISIDQYRKLLETAFNQVSDPKDWRGPISAEVPWNAATLYQDAVEFYTAVKPSFSSPVFKDVDGYRMQVTELTCIGYRAGPAGS